MISIEEISSDYDAINNPSKVLDTYDEHRYVCKVDDAYSIILDEKIVANERRIGSTEELIDPVCSVSDIKKKHTLAIEAKSNERLKKSLSYLTASNTIHQDESYYDELQEFYGIVQAVNHTKQMFTVLFKIQRKTRSEIIVDFSFDDLKYESDRNLIKLGVKIVWLIGQEIHLNKNNGRFKQGQQIRIAQLFIRRTPCLTNRQITRAEENANEWAKFFSES